MVINNNKKCVIDISELIDKFKEQYKNVYVQQFDRDIFIYRTLGRKEYSDIFIDEDLSDQDKEEEICKLCVLYPENFDYENCEEAGLPTELAAKIIENSYLSQENRTRALTFYRNEMYDLDNQINCLILAAFPNFTLEEVENWDVVTACKYLSRAEWILTRTRGLKFTEKDPNSSYVNAQQNTTSMEVTDDMIKSTASESDVGHNGKPKKAKMTPEKLAELKAKYPEIPWEEDYGNMGIDGIINQPTVDDMPVALRPPSRRYK